MKERLLEFLKNENKSSAQLAEEIGVQASGISHILSGRNNPSLDFVLKMLDRYKFLSTDWLLFGKGTMYKEPKMQTLFDFPDEVPAAEANPGATIQPQPGEIPDFSKVPPAVLPDNSIKVIKIVWFYDNRRFEEFYPQSL